MEEIINGYPVQELPNRRIQSQSDVKNLIIIVLSSLVLVLGGWGVYGKFNDYKDSLIKQGIKTGKEQGYLAGQTDLGSAIIQELSKTGRILINTKDAQGNPLQLSLVPQLPVPADSTDKPKESK